MMKVLCFGQASHIAYCLVELFRLNSAHHLKPCIYLAGSYGLKIAITSRSEAGPYTGAMGQARCTSTQER